MKPGSPESVYASVGRITQLTTSGKSANVNPPFHRLRVGDRARFNERFKATGSPIYDRVVRAVTEVWYDDCPLCGPPVKVRLDPPDNEGGRDVWVGFLEKVE